MMIENDDIHAEIAGSVDGEAVVASAVDRDEEARSRPGDFFDGTEMDEMLSLRVLTLTDEEKQEKLPPAP